MFCAPVRPLPGSGGLLSVTMHWSSLPWTIVMRSTQGYLWRVQLVQNFGCPNDGTYNTFAVWFSLDASLLSVDITFKALHHMGFKLPEEPSYPHHINLSTWSSREGILWTLSVKEFQLTWFGKRAPVLLPLRSVIFSSQRWSRSPLSVWRPDSTNLHGGPRVACNTGDC